MVLVPSQQFTFGVVFELHRNQISQLVFFTEVCLVLGKKQVYGFSYCQGPTI